MHKGARKIASLPFAAGRAVARTAARAAVFPVAAPLSCLNKGIVVPDDISGLITYNPADEADPAEAGMDRKSVDAIWKAVLDLYRSGMHPAVSFCLRRNGKVVLNRAIGFAKGAGPGDPPDAVKVPATPETPICLFSASKAVSAMCIHLLVEWGKIRLSDPVDYYIPDFSAHGKQNTTIFQVLSHFSGFPAVPGKTDPDILFDFEECSRVLCEARPLLQSGAHAAYHAITGGFILGAIVKKVTGKDIREFLAENIQKPMGFSTFNYGLPPDRMEDAAVNYYTGLPVIAPINVFVKRVLSASWQEVVKVSNDRRFMEAIIPSGNMYSTADEASRFFQMLLNYGELDGVRIFSPLTVRRATIEARPQEFDRMLFLPMRYSAGFMLGNDPVGLYGPFTRECFGHWGFINSFCWADRRRNTVGSLLTTGKPLLGSHLVPHAKLLAALSRHCPSVPGGGEARSRVNRLLGSALKM